MSNSALCLKVFLSKLPPASVKQNRVWLLTIINTDNHALNLGSVRNWEVCPTI